MVDTSRAERGQSSASLRLQISSKTSRASMVANQADQVVRRGPKEFFYGVDVKELAPLQCRPDVGARLPAELPDITAECRDCRA